MMKGQAFVEFLFAFAVTIIFISLLSSAVLAHKDKLEEKSQDIEKIVALEPSARAIEAALNTGIEMHITFPDVYAAEDNRFTVSYKGDVIEIKGVFTHETAEPI
ncbi:hypothetical protein KKB44_05775 [Candidatus Micrarchaeota archaeon]|nr:hypothetical protein [Candidatus Micrarchaeota archaeon]